MSSWPASRPCWLRPPAATATRGPDQPAPAAAPASTRTIVHPLSEVPLKPARAVVHSSPALDNALALGVTPVLANSSGRGWLEIPAAVELVDGEPGVERVAPARPDLILGWQSNQANHATFNAVAARVGIPGDRCPSRRLGRALRRRPDRAPLPG